MVKWKVILGGCLLLFGASCVRADMTGGFCPKSGKLDCGVAVRAKTDKQSSGQGGASEEVSLGSLEMSFAGDLADAADSADGGQRSDVHVLSGGPGSVALFFSALTGLGAWRLGRSARKFHLASVPDWYHTGGPVQVGHVSAVNPDLSAPATIGICDSPGEQSIRLHLRRAASLRLKSQCAPVAAMPRGPPLPSL